MECFSIERAKSQINPTSHMRSLVQLRADLARRLRDTFLCISTLNEVVDLGVGFVSLCRLKYVITPSFPRGVTGHAITAGLGRKLGTYGTQSDCALVREVLCYNMVLWSRKERSSFCNEK